MIKENSPGQITWLVSALSQSAEVVGPIPQQGTPGTARSPSLSFPLSLKSIKTNKKRKEKKKIHKQEEEETT